MGTFHDLASSAIEQIPFGGDTDSFRIVSMDTGTKGPGLEKSTYKNRLEQCDPLALSFGIEALGDIKTQETSDLVQRYINQDGLEGGDLLKYLVEAQNCFADTFEA